MLFWHGNGMSGWGYALMTVSMVLFWALMIAGVAVLVRYLGRDSRATPISPPQQVLAERFAHGDIDEEEYRRRLDILRGHPRSDVDS